MPDALAVLPLYAFTGSPDGGEISRRLEYDSAPYHAGLDYGRRKTVERKFGNQDLAAVVTTATVPATSRTICLPLLSPPIFMLRRRWVMVYG